MALFPTLHIPLALRTFLSSCPHHYCYYYDCNFVRQPPAHTRVYMCCVCVFVWTCLRLIKLPFTQQSTQTDHANWSQWKQISRSCLGPGATCWLHGWESRSNNEIYVIFYSILFSILRAIHAVSLFHFPPVELALSMHTPVPFKGFALSWLDKSSQQLSGTK